MWLQQSEQEETSTRRGCAKLGYVSIERSLDFEGQWESIKVLSRVIACYTFFFFHRATFWLLFKVLVGLEEGKKQGKEESRKTSLEIISIVQVRDIGDMV